MSAILRRATADGPLWLASLACGVAIAALDLSSSSTRLPLILSVLAAVTLLSLVQPSWSWRWALAVTLWLPIAVALGFERPYAYDRFDAFYPVVPAVAVAFGAGWLRGRVGRLRTA